MTAKKGAEFDPADGAGFLDYTEGKRPGGDMEDEPCFVCKDSKSYKKNKIILCDNECGWGAHRECIKMPLSAKLPKMWWCCKGCQKMYIAKRPSSAGPKARPPPDAPATAPAPKRQKTMSTTQPSPAPGTAPPAQALVLPNESPATAIQSSGHDRKSEQPPKSAAKASGGAAGVVSPVKKATQPANTGPQVPAAKQQQPAPAANADGAVLPNDNGQPCATTSAAAAVTLPAPVFVNDKVTVESRLAIMGALGRLLRHLNKPQAWQPLVQAFRMSERTEEGIHQVTYHYTEVMMCWEVGDVEGVLAVFRERYGLDV